jgi:hypothetical protein
MLNKSGRVIYTRAKHLRGAIIVLPFFSIVLISYIYLTWRAPPLSLQDLIVFSAPLLVGVIHYCKTWIYRSPIGAPVLGMAVGGALFFPVVVCAHVGDYDVSDNGAGLAVGIVAWALSTFFIWRLFQPGTDMFWNTVLEPFRRDRRRWVVLAVVPLVWAVYAFGAFELVDTQFDGTTGRVFHGPVASRDTRSAPACLILHPGFLHAPWRQPAACPPSG